MQGISGTNMIKLQRAQNTLARIVVGCRRNEHITPVLRRLHWLPVKQRITFKIATLVQKVRTTQQSTYLAVFSLLLLLLLLLYSYSLLMDYVT